MKYDSDWFVHLGDSANLMLAKGGVITGKVVNSAGEPLTGLSVNALRIGNIDLEAPNTPAIDAPYGSPSMGPVRPNMMPPGMITPPSGGPPVAPAPNTIIAPIKPTGAKVTASADAAWYRMK